MQKQLAGIFLGAGLAMAATAQAGDYKHKDWPVQNDGTGIYSFTDAGKARAVSLCAAYYTADVQVMDEKGTASGNYGQIIRAHEVTMRDAYRSKYTGGQQAMDEMVKDMIWHFGNAAQYKAYQEFKDSANMSCESYALETGVVTGAYLDSFNEKLLSGL